MMRYLYPTFCLHCDMPLKEIKRVLCPSCSKMMHLLPPHGRCRRCFAELEKGAAICKACREQRADFRALSACFELHSPAGSLLHAFRKGARLLAPLIASFMVVQLEKQSWKDVDYLIPIPLAFSRYLVRGYNQSLLLAKEISRMTKIPVYKALKREKPYFSSHLLQEEMRSQLPSQLFGWRKKKEPLSNKRVLIIDDMMSTKATLKRAGWTLQEAAPRAIYGLTFGVEG